MYEALERRRALGEVMRGVAEEDEAAAAAAEGASAAARDDARDEREDRAGDLLLRLALLGCGLLRRLDDDFAAGERRGQHCPRCHAELQPDKGKGKQKS